MSEAIGFSAPPCSVYLNLLHIDMTRKRCRVSTHVTSAKLAGSSPLSPVIKSIVVENEPAAAHLRGRVGLMHRIESRFRFLAVSSRH